MAASSAQRSRLVPRDARDDAEAGDGLTQARRLHRGVRLPAGAQRLAGRAPAIRRLGYDAQPDPLRRRGRAGRARAHRIHRGQGRPAPRPRGTKPVGACGRRLRQLALPHRQLLRDALLPADRADSRQCRTASRRLRVSGRPRRSLSNGSRRVQGRHVRDRRAPDGGARRRHVPSAVAVHVESAGLRAMADEPRGGACAGARHPRHGGRLSARARCWRRAAVVGATGGASPVGRDDHDGSAHLRRPRGSRPRRQREQHQRMDRSVPARRRHTGVAVQYRPPAGRARRGHLGESRRPAAGRRRLVDSADARPDQRGVVRRGDEPGPGLRWSSAAGQEPLHQRPRRARRAHRDPALVRATAPQRHA